MDRPILKQYQDFRSGDFIEHPIWMSAYGMDQEELWSDEVDEATYRPWNGALPYRCAEINGPMVVVRGWFELGDGTRARGFATPPHPPSGAAGSALSYTQPQMFLPSGGSIGFWFGGRTISEDEKKVVYRSLQKQAESVFPLRFGFDQGLIDTAFEVTITGFFGFADDLRTILETR